MNFKKYGFCSIAAIGFVMLTACDTENATEVPDTSGMGVLASNEKLPECTQGNLGEMLFVEDSAAIYYCTGSEWSSLDGKDGKNGSNATASDGESGTSCITKPIDEGFEVICGDSIIGTIKNGSSELAINGKNGKSCSANLDQESGNTIITCDTDDGKGISYTFKNGVDGKSAYELSGSTQTLEKWIESLNGNNGKNCSVTPSADGKSYALTCEGSDDVVIKNGENGKSAYELSGSTLTPEEWAKSLNGDNGKNCSVTPSTDGKSYTLSCEGSDDVVIKNGENGKSAYELSGSTLTFEEWVESLNGDNGKNCSVTPSTDGKSYTLSCEGSDDVVIKNGELGTGCTINDQKNGLVTVSCGEGDSKTEVTLNKAMCGNTPYDPAEFFCDGFRLLKVCKGPTAERDMFYDPENVMCAEGNGVLYTHGEMTYGEQTYKTVTIKAYMNGSTYNRTWMAENLNYNVSGSWCNNCETYGRHYRWETAKKVCPSGWSLPSINDWRKLVEVMGESAGYKLKSKSGWSNNGNGTDVIDFTILPAGYGSTEYQEFYNTGTRAEFWSSTSANTRQVNVVEFYHDGNGADTDSNENPLYFSASVRCIKN